MPTAGPNETPRKGKVAFNVLVELSALSLPYGRYHWRSPTRSQQSSVTVSPLVTERYGGPMKR